MPIYEYICRKCDAKFEKLVKTMADNGKVQCPQCHSKDTARALSTFAVGAESARSSSSMPEMCQRCGRDGPCPMDD